ncbi:iron ABC transporter substrate-binding protein [Cryobacterium sp. MLB-32]|uniref:extracellular solute-binding protein n=1 Tax=Cryobacterium sp. MLB-32 TaxID=1529318 RepID=UPI0004E6AFA6|nr:extracellular solute-binding protein [Cryobacterium sp. MLB-32]KFF58440.1 iron ABC transporter substrate-binding protein [Cryobacterium sp. MLB-32]
MTKRRLKFALISGGLGLALGLSGCGIDAAPTSSDAASETSLTIYTARDKGLAESVVADFVAANPDYDGKVQILTLGAQEALERIRAEKVNPQGDIWWGGTSQQMQQAASDDVLSPAPQSVIDAVPEASRDADGLWVGEMLLAEVIVYNHDMITAADAPKDWDDLIDPALGDQIAIRDVQASGTMRSIYSAMIDREVEASGSADAGYAWLEALDANTKVYAANPTDLYLRLTRQEAAITAWNLQDVMLQIEQQDAPYTPVVPTSGAPMLVDGVAKIKGGPSSDGADAFLSFLISEETQTKLAETYFQIPTIDLAAAPSWLADLNLKEMDVNWTRIAENETEWIDYWAANIKGQS